MANTDWNSSLEVSRWSATLLREAMKQIFFRPFMGKNRQKNAIINVLDELQSKKGKDVTFGLITNLDGDGVTNNEVLEGNEEAMDSFAQTVTLKRIGNAVRDQGQLEDQKFLINFRLEGRESLAIWLAEKVDSDIFTVMQASPTRSITDDASESFDISGATPKSALTTSDKISPAGISACVRVAKKPVGSTEMKIRPVNVNGKKYYVMIIGNNSAYDWKRNAESQQALREAQLRGPDNPIFQGALGVWDGVVLHEHEDISTFSDGGGASVVGDQNLFMGAQAVSFARNKVPTWVEKQFDYDDLLGIAVRLIYGVSKTKFNSEDFASLAHYCATTDFSAST